MSNPRVTSPQPGKKGSHKGRKIRDRYRENIQGETRENMSLESKITWKGKEKKRS